MIFFVNKRIRIENIGRKSLHFFFNPAGEVNTTIQYGCMLVRSLSVSKLATHTVRVFAVRHTKQKKKQETLVQQFHYTEWPDHGVPSHALPLLAFVRKSSNANPEGSGPIGSTAEPRNNKSQGQGTNKFFMLLADLCHWQCEE